MTTPTPEPAMDDIELPPTVENAIADLEYAVRYNRADTFVRHAISAVRAAVRAAIAADRAKGGEEVEDLVRRIHRAVKRGANTKDHGLIDNLKCILDHVLPDPFEPSPAPETREGLSEDAVLQAAREAFGFDGGLQAINEHDLRNLARTLSTSPAPTQATQDAEQAAQDRGTPGPWFVRKLERGGELRDCFVSAPDCNGFAYDAEILGDDEYRDDIQRKLADCELIVRAVNALRAATLKGPS